MRLPGRRWATPPGSVVAVLGISSLGHHTAQVCNTYISRMSGLASPFHCASASNDICLTWQSDIASSQGIGGREHINAMDSDSGESQKSDLGAVLDDQPPEQEELVGPLCRGVQPLGKSSGDPRVRSPNRRPSSLVPAFGRSSTCSQRLLDQGAPLKPSLFMNMGA